MGKEGGRITTTRYRDIEVARRPLNLEAMHSDIDATSGDCEGERVAWLMGMSFRESTRI